MKIDISEITGILKQEISQYESKLDVMKVGRVVEVGDGIARIYGMEDALAGEILLFENDIIGEIFNLEEDSLGAVVYGDYTKVREGSDVRSTGKLMSVPVGEELIGRIITPLCQPLDGGPAIQTQAARLLESDAPNIAQRQPVRQPLQTGIKSIDSMIPIGRGQRELIIGDRKTGKTAIALDTIINQKGKDVICVYVAIGQKDSTVAEVVDVLKRHGAMNHTIVIAASAADSAPTQYIAPYAGCAVAEYFMYDKRRDTLCIYDDLSKHAVAYRQLSLLLRRPAGREAYPGDIFYLHSRLLERSSKLSDQLGAGSLTALPIVETLEGQISAYIPTNIISITDGQIYLQRDLFHAGIRPAIDVGVSVSRVGGDAQVQAMKKVAARLRLDLASYYELLDFARLGTELDPASQRRLERGKRMVELLKQPQFSPLSVGEEVITILAGSSGLLDDIPVEAVSGFATGMLRWLNETHAELASEITKTGKLTDELVSKITECVNEYKTTHKVTQS
ncbi:MAG: F0F1 ATP synthase subunit alpha [Planctomycetes bacterium RBG_13_62_9]|nr:MAG: F0F1 ATP synthase subunit alpha [Planctomycetes bacterium RBG_13_62_9]